MTAPLSRRLLVLAALAAPLVACLAWPQSGLAEPEPDASSVAEPPAPQLPQGTSQQLLAGRKAGWLAVSQIIPAIQRGDSTNFPGGAAWLVDFGKATKGLDPDADPATWPAVNADALVTNNPNYWRAHYEIAPGDPAVTLLHGGLLMLGSEPQRASYVFILGLQRPGISAPVRQIMQRLATQAQQALHESNQVANEGIKLFDQGKIAEALKQHEAALQLFPQNGFAHYEWGLTRRQQEWAAAGITPETKNGKILINQAWPTSKEVAAAFARARQHDPFQWRAYQGDDKATIERLMVLLKKGMPNWEKLIKTHPKLVEDPLLLELGEGLQGAQQDDLALLVRQIVVARRGGFAPEDHPYIGASLRRIAPGENVEKAIQRLAGKKLAFRQIIAPEEVNNSAP